MAHLPLLCFNFCFIKLSTSTRFNFSSIKKGALSKVFCLFNQQTFTMCMLVVRHCASSLCVMQRGSFLLSLGYLSLYQVSDKMAVIPRLSGIAFQSSYLGSVWNYLVQSSNGCERLRALEYSIYTHTINITQKPVQRAQGKRNENRNKSLLNCHRFPLKDNYEFWFLSFSYPFFLSPWGFWMKSDKSHSKIGCKSQP